MESVDKIAKMARESLGTYCIDECKAKCCKRGFLLLNSDKEVDLIVGSENVDDYLEKGILEKGNNGYFYNNSKKTCRNLDENTSLCSAWQNTSRPLVCRDYPIFVVKDFVMLGKTCQAVENGLLDEYIEMLKKTGVKII